MYFGFHPWNLAMDKSILKEPLNLLNRLPHILVYFIVVCSTTIIYGSTYCCSSITTISIVYKVCCNCTYWCVSIMVCVWPLSPSSCEFGVVAVVVTNWIIGETSIVVAYYMNFICGNTYCSSLLLELLLKLAFQIVPLFIHSWPPM